MAEKRIYKREDVFLDAEIVCAGYDPIVLQVRDLSLGGIFLEAENIELPPIGSEVDLTLLVHFNGEEFHTFRSKIMRIDGSGVALKFVNIDVRYLSFLERVLEFKSARIMVA